MGAGQSLYTQSDTKYALHTLQRCVTPYICDPDRVSVPQSITIYERPLAGLRGEGVLISRSHRSYAPQPVAMERAPAGGARFPLFTMR